MAKSKRSPRSPEKGPVAPAAVLPEVAGQHLAAWVFGVAGLVVLAGVVVRVIAAQDSFWFDEVWSLFLFSQPDSTPWEIFKFHHDNNHQLISLWMYACGLCDSWFIYRIPSLLAGVGTIALAAVFARRFGNWAALAAAVLTAGSFILITYASEARGYALAGCFALAACLVLERYFARGGHGWCVLFAGLVILGFLSHLTFLFCYAGTLAWSLALGWQARKGFGAVVRDTLCCHAVPLAFLAGFYVWHVRALMIGGGPVYSIWQVVVETSAATLGGVGHPSVELILALGALGGLAAGLAWLWRTQWSLAVLFLVTILLAPGLVLLVQRPPLLYVRYFYVPVLFFLLLAGMALGRWAERGSQSRLAVALVLGVYLLGNAWAIGPFLQFGRGQYLAALEYLGQQSPGGQVVFQSGHDFETQRMLAFYSRYLPPAVQLNYLNQGDNSGRVPEWTVVNSQELPVESPAAITDARGRLYRLDRVFPYSGLSGYHWKVYRRTAGADRDRSGTLPPAGS